MQAIAHYPSCSADYPEKVEWEAPQATQEIEADGFTILCCVDCGAFVIKEEG